MNLGTPDLEVEQGDTCDMRVWDKLGVCGKQAAVSYQNKRFYMCLACALQLQDLDKK